MKSWGDPEPLAAEPKEHIDVACLPGAIADISRAISKSLTVSPDMVAASALGVLSVCVNRHRVIIDDGRDWNEPLALYMMGVAPPGEKKSPVLNLLLNPVKEWVRRANEERRPLIAESKQKYKNLQRQLKKAESDFENGKGPEDETIRLAKELDSFQKIKEARLFSGDTTTEKLADLLQENDGQFSIVSTEGGILETIAGRYQNGIINSDLYLQAFNAESVSVDRKNSGTVILDDPTLSIILFCQPVVLSKLIERDELRNNGFVDRFLPFAPQSCIGRDRFNAPALPPQVVSRYANTINRLLDMDSTYYMRLSPDAREVFSKFYDTFTSSIPLVYEDMTGWASKHRGIVARIAGILQLVDDGKAIISGDNMMKAVMLADYFQEQARTILRTGGMNQAEQDAKYILGRIKTMKDKTHIDDAGRIVLPYRILRQWVHRKGLEQKSDYNEPLQVLYDKGYVTFNADEFDRVTELYTNPAVWG